RGGVLSVEEKMENKRISRLRVFVENVIAKFKVFKILANKYRNRRKRFEIRAALICGLINHENQN
ncbi:MAG: IS5/IS1182 family transposase, partial [Candidatus Bathyarchaeota archaeon]|nr:IS5/IS1182 family transposase [Candidatus Termiticorpusculum sp.]